VIGEKLYIALIEGGTVVSKTVTRQRIVLGLSLHSLMWSVFSIWLWTRFGNAWQSDIVPILAAPVYFGTFYLRSRAFWALGAAGLLVSLFLIATTLFTIRKQSWWLVLVAHAAVVLYWFIGFVLLAIGD
jgi:hypothetical protein